MAGLGILVVGLSGLALGADSLNNVVSDCAIALS